ncbi:MAG: hypothetical protein ACR2HR_17065 [Euzebya sp.]
MRRLVIILAVLATFTTACGGADTTSDSGSTSSSADDTSADAPADAVAGIDSAACTEAANALTAVPQSIATALTGTVDKAEVQSQIQAITDLADSVPDEFQADFQIIADTYSEAASTLDGINLEPGQVPDAETQAALTDLSAAFSDGAFATASANLSGYFAAGCQ